MPSQLSKSVFRSEGFAGTPMPTRNDQTSTSLPACRALRSCAAGSHCESPIVFLLRPPLDKGKTNDREALGAAAEQLLSDERGSEADSRLAAPRLPQQTICKYPRIGQTPTPRLGWERDGLLFVRSSGSLRFQRRKVAATSALKWASKLRMLREVQSAASYSPKVFGSAHGRVPARGVGAAVTKPLARAPSTAL